ncbi:hypothetical protein AWH56_26515 [Anaerobacillus isosaccharinicus]|uniref:Uncharacterized protein n=1 Tax=Anaerobacillus isosaccharinicus TaxID=1532552 RepID=A0AC62A429_9BACI|nr:hypothetical protein [Anaerobacillus isosaccharinicus]
MESDIELNIKKNTATLSKANDTVKLDAKGETENSALSNGKIGWVKYRLAKAMKAAKPRARDACQNDFDFSSITKIILCIGFYGLIVLSPQR